MAKKYQSVFLCVFFAVCLCFQAGAETSGEAADSDTAVESEEIQALPNGYRGILLGADIDAVKQLLQKDSEFGFRGDRDVSLLLSENRSLIETAGPNYIKRAWFQFHDDLLYIISVALNTGRIDYYSLYTSLVKKYGEPGTVNPRTAVWENDTVRMILERPLTVRYISLPVFTGLQDRKNEENDYLEQLKDEFIGDF